MRNSPRHARRPQDGSEGVGGARHDLECTTFQFGNLVVVPERPACGPHANGEVRQEDRDLCLTCANEVGRQGIQPLNLRIKSLNCCPSLTWAFVRTSSLTCQFLFRLFPTVHGLFRFARGFFVGSIVIILDVAELSRVRCTPGHPCEIRSPVLFYRRSRKRR